MLANRRKMSVTSQLTTCPGLGRLVLFLPCRRCDLLRMYTLMFTFGLVLAVDSIPHTLRGVRHADRLQGISMKNMLLVNVKLASNGGQNVSGPGTCHSVVFITAYFEVSILSVEISKCTNVSIRVYKTRQKTSYHETD